MGGGAKHDEIFGNRVRGLIWYRLSPYELKIFPTGYLSHWATKWWGKFTRNVFYAGPRNLTFFSSSKLLQKSLF